jgi:GT2 family glycosyltransferase
MLASLQATLPAGLAHEIVFVDDGSTDGTRDWLQTLPGDPFRVVLNERNLGYAGANNRAAAVARGEFLVLLNNDLVLQPRWLEPMLRAQRRLGARAGLVGNIQLDAKSGAVDHAGIVLNANGKPEHLRERPPFFSRLLRPERAMPAVTGACLLVARALWQQLGGFDEAYMNGGEDIDLGFRARAAGRLNVVALRSVVRHHVSASPGRKLRDEENSYRLMRRWQAEFLAAADRAKRAWRREHLATVVMPEPKSADHRHVLHLVAYWLQLTRREPADAVAAVAAGQQRELAHWRAMFGE